MNKHVKEILQQIRTTVGAWPDIEAVTYIPSEDDVLDPYFFIRFDVYTHNGIPSEEQRLQAFHYAGGFESSPFHRKDRFLVHDIPVRVDYKTVGDIPDPAEPSSVARYLSREEGTYPMFRIVESCVLQKNSDWFPSLQESLHSIDDRVWRYLQEFFFLRVEHHLADFGAAVYRNDALFQRTALAGFIRGLCSSLFAVNRRFEPSARGIQKHLFQLSELPEGFEGRFQVLLESGLTPQRQFEIGDMLTKSTLQLAGAQILQ